MEARFLRACVICALLPACEATPGEDEPPWVTPFGPDARTGFAECDAVIAAYKPCIDAKAPASVRDDVRMGLEKTIQFWLETAAQPSASRDAVRNGITHLCHEGLQRWTKTAAAFGCDPPVVSDP